MSTGEGRGTLFASFIPRYLARLLETTGPEDLANRPLPKSAALLFCDISGFTPLSEALGRHGKAGTEELTIHLNAYFQALLDVVEGWGGDTVKFGGDAVTVLFEKGEREELAGALRRACACGLDILSTLGASRQAKTPWGIFDLRLKIGASAGPLLAGVLGDPELQMEHILAGTALDRMAEAEHHASPGDLVVDAALQFLAGAGLVLEPEGEGFARVKGLTGSAGRPPHGDIPRPEAERVRPFLLPSVYGQLEAGSEALLSDHRPVVTVFAAFTGLDYADPKSLHRLDAYFRRVAALLRGYGGSFNRMDMGDKGSKFLCFFGAPESYENNEERAVAFALALRALEDEMPWLGCQRVGISAGTAYCGLMGSAERREYTVMGDAVNVAARLMGAAGEVGILVTKAVREATRARVRYGPFRRLTLKGKSAPLNASAPLSQIRRRVPRSVQSHLGFMGRVAERESLSRAFKRAGLGRPSPRVVVGEAGLGKTALLEACLAQWREKGARVAMGQCPAAGAEPYQGWAEIFRHLLTPGREGRDAMLRLWEALLPDQTEFIPLGLRLIGYAVPLSAAAQTLEPKEREEKLADLLARTLRALAVDHPVVVALDDLHAADEGTRALLEELPRRTRGARVLYLAASRPGAPLPPGAVTVELRGLPEAEAEALALAASGARRHPADLQRFLYHRSGGSPLFLLELVRDLKERQTLKVDREGRARWDADAAETLPGSVEGLLLARIDRLPLVTRNVLKVSACLGMAFDLDLLHGVFLPRMAPSELERQLVALKEIGVHPGDAGRNFAFAHATLRETAYGSVLLANRKAIHLRAGERLEARDAEGESPGLLAHHFGHAEAWDRALPYALKAARSAMDRYAYKQALVHFEEATKWAGKAGLALPLEELLAMAEMAVQTGSHETGLSLISRVFGFDGAPKASRLEAMFLKVRLYHDSGAYGTAVLAAQALVMEAGASPLLRTKTMAFWAADLFHLGRLQDAEEILRDACALAGSEGLDPHELNLVILRGAILFQRGDYAGALDACGSSQVWAEIHSNYPVAVRAHISISNALREEGRAEESAEHARKALKLASLVGSQINVMGSATALACALNSVHRTDEAIEVLEEHRPMLDTAKLPYAACAYLNQLGVSYYFKGEYAKALRSYRKCRTVAKCIANQQWMAHSTYNIADGLNTMGLKVRAVRDYLQALRRFEATRDIPYIVQATNDLMALYLELGDKKEEGSAARSFRETLKRMGATGVHHEVERPLMLQRGRRPVGRPPRALVRSPGGFLSSR